MNRNISIPTSVRKLIRQKIALRLLAFVMLSLFFCLLTILWGDTIFSMPNLGMAVKGLLCIIFVGLSAILTKVYRIVTDFSYGGKVKKVTVKTTVDSRSSIRPTRENLYRKNTVFLTVETESGKTVKRKAYEATVKSGVDVDRYKVGDRVLHLHGTNVTVILPTNADTHCFCPLCDGANEIKNEVCIHCGRPLIKDIFRT